MTHARSLDPRPEPGCSSVARAIAVIDYNGAFLCEPDDNSIEPVHHESTTERTGLIDHVWIRVPDLVTAVDGRPPTGIAHTSFRGLTPCARGQGEVMTRVPVPLVALVAFAALAAGSSPAASPIDRAALLARFEPVLFFHPDEDWAPETADRFVAKARLEQQVAAGSWIEKPKPAPTSTAGCAFTLCYRFDLPCSLKGGDGCYEKSRSTASDWARPVVYGRVLDVPAGTAPPAGVAGAPRYLVRYWLFYEFDDWRTAHERMWQAHEGDWESISVGLDAQQQPLFAAYSEHCSGSVRPWSRITTRGESHPVAYVALGSHANYFTNASTPTAFTICLRSYLSHTAVSKATRIVELAQERLVDRMGAAHASGPADVSGVTPLGVIPLAGTLPAWARFPGRWSEGQLLWVGTTPRTFTSISEGAGPATPNWNATTIPAFWHSSSS
jgi:hypothetical protein